MATPEHQALFRNWLGQERLELMTCRPVINGKRVPPSDEVITLAFFDGEDKNEDASSRFGFKKIDGAADVEN